MLQVMPREPLWVPQVVLTGALQGASSNTHGCPLGAPLDAPGDAHGCPGPWVPLWVPPRPAGRPVRCPGAGGRWSRGGGKSHPWAKSGKRRETAPKRRRGGSRPDRAYYPNQKSRRSASAPPAAPPAFSGVPAPPGGRGCTLPAVIFYSFAGFSLSLCRSRYTPRAHQGREPGPGPPRCAPPAPPGPA